MWMPKMIRRYAPSVLNHSAHSLSSCTTWSGTVPTPRPRPARMPLRRNGLVKNRPHPVTGVTPVFAPSHRLDGRRLPIRHAPPTLGEGTRELLQQLLALSGEQLQALQARGVLTLPDVHSAS
jgi:crotonobetainyl-CoA:carnitine CoA-transferase CaiB-like acyl-CoA transferase